MRLISFILSFFVFTFLCSQSKTDVLINSIIQKDKLSHNTIIAKFLADFENTEEVIDIINKYSLESTCNDEIFIGSENTLYLEKTVFKSLESLTNKINENCNSFAFNSIENTLNVYELIWEIFNKNYCFFTKPMRSKDGRYAIIKYEVLSGTIFGNYSRTYLCKFINNEWIIDTIVAFEMD